MSAFPRALRASLAAFSGLALVLPVLAQTASAPKARTTTARPAPAPSAPASSISAKPAIPWLFRGSDIRPNPAWTLGELPNGLRYAVRKNGVPPGQVAVRVLIDAGSLMEEDSEQGFAHLMEHLAFRSSKYVAGGDTKQVWQRLGATFGSDSNASTTPTQTVYKLDLPGATDAKLDEALKIFAGMMTAPGISPAGLSAELPAVLAEQREAPGPQVRYSDAVRGTFFAGQPLADRSPIGTIKTLQAATPASGNAPSGV